MTSLSTYHPFLLARRDASHGSENRRLERKLTVTWSLLTFNVLTYERSTALFPVPNAVGQALTQGALEIALLLALNLNSRLIVRKNGFLLLTSLLALGSVIVIPGANPMMSTAYRTLRFALFIAVLWLLTPHWGRRDLLLPRIHIRVMTWICGSLLLGILVSPHLAFGKGSGRLQGIIWPIQSTQAAHYAAILIGMTIVLWFCGALDGRRTSITVAISVTLLLLTHTRTALAACVAGLLVAALSLMITNPRVRKVLLGIAVGITIASMTTLTAIVSWMERGQSVNGQLATLTGRTKFWGPLLTFPRDSFQMTFGFGISNGFFNGLPVDSNWILSYQDQGLWGVTICALILVFLITKSCFETRPLSRALSLFLTIYCLVASFTEVGFTGASPYSLDLAIAASLLVSQSEQIIGIHRRPLLTDRIGSS